MRERVVDRPAPDVSLRGLRVMLAPVVEADLPTDCEITGEVSFESLGIKLPKPEALEGGFIVNGQNTTALIQSLQSINNIPIAELERRMKPGLLSDAGFLGEHESLLTILADDNDLVLSLGLSHQIIARELEYISRAPSSRDGLLQRGKSVFEVTVLGSFGSQVSPFEDGTSAGHNVIVCNRTNKKICAFSGLHIEMIGRYGFYEGKDTGYRLDPSNVVETLDYLLDPENKA